MEEKRIELVCKKCGGTMVVDAERPIISCPYCGCSEMIIEGDSVKVERIRSATFKEMEETRINREREIEEKKYKEAFLDKDITAIFSTVSAFFDTMLLMAASLNGLFALSVAGIFIMIGSVGAYIYAKKDYMDHGESYRGKKLVYLALQLLGWVIVFRLLAAFQ